MMKKRILISILTILFLVSTTGLPIWSHYCQMSGKKSLNGCGMCNVKNEKDFSCCSEDLYANEIKLSSENYQCCIAQFDYKKIEDNFSLNDYNPLKILHSVTVVFDSSILVNEKTECLSYQSKFNLPPPKFGKELLNTIHQLKIDLPVC
jgi:hypothetical protein